MNISQMELIEDLLQSAPPNVQAFCSDDAKFFVRNLQTVQGDEMDRIIVSLTYGRNADGRFNASILRQFTKEGGDRRLNVAITRSRSGMIVVSSMTVADLAGSSATSDGFRCLKAFLADLEATAVSRNFGITSQRFQKRNNGVSNVVFCESPFEEQVVEFLENQGFTELECQYGCGKFRIDIVVKERGKNVLAIECDGAAYHSSLVARTRDRARQRILEERGWRGRIHRVWSTNWWYFENQEKQAILDAIAGARHAQQDPNSDRPSENHKTPLPSSSDVHEPNGGEVQEKRNIKTDDDGNINERTRGTNTDSQSEITPIASDRKPQSSSQAKLEIEPQKTIDGLGVTADELRNVLYRFIPQSGKIGREKLLEDVSAHLNLHLRKARPELNKMIAAERRVGCVELDAGWEHIWRLHKGMKKGVPH